MAIPAVVKWPLPSIWLFRRIFQVGAIVFKQATLHIACVAVGGQNPMLWGQWFSFVIELHDDIMLTDPFGPFIWVFRHLIIFNFI